VFSSTGIGQLAATLKQPTDKSALSNAHHINEQMFESKQARRGRVYGGIREGEPLQAC